MEIVSRVLKFEMRTKLIVTETSFVALHSSLIHIKAF